MISLTQEDRLRALMAKIPALADMVRVTALPGGLTNMNYRIDTKTASYVMRAGDASSQLLCINRDHERVNTARAAQAGVGASVIDYLPGENILLIEWIDGITLHSRDIQTRPGLLPRMAEALRALHAGPAFEGEFYFPRIRKKYLETVLTNQYFLPPGYLRAEPLIQSLEEALIRQAEPFVPCNNDLLAENFMDDGKKIWIIDYEYAGQNEASFDLGNLASELSISDAQLTTLCDAYWQKHLPSKIMRARAWSIIARYGWVMWASIQEAVSRIGFDFRAWGLQKWDSVLPELEDSHFDKLLENLKKYTS